MATQTTRRPGAHDVEAARRAGAEAAELVLGTQIAAGMNPDEIDAAIERVLGDRFTDPTPASTAFYAAYDETATDMVREMRDPTPEAGGPEAG